MELSESAKGEDHSNPFFYINDTREFGLNNSFEWSTGEIEMANPTGNYEAWINGVGRSLSLTVDSAGNLVASMIGSDPIIGSYNDTTGKITFSELIKEPGGFFLGGPFAPSYLGFEAIQNGALTFAGTYTELVAVRVGPGSFVFEQITHGWYAIQILPQ